jgi:hypothetical protein
MILTLALSLIVASYDSQGYGGGIQRRFHSSMLSLRESYFTPGGLPLISSAPRRYLKSERVKYGRDSHGTRSREWMRCEGQQQL